MPSIIECDNCGATNKEMIEVCGICYDEVCPTMLKPVLICVECESNQFLIIDPGESLFT